MSLFDQSCQPCTACAPAGTPIGGETPLPPIWCVQVKHFTISRYAFAVIPYLNFESISGIQQPGASNPVNQVWGDLFTTQFEQITGASDPANDFSYTSSYDNIEGSPGLTWTTYPTALSIAADEWFINGLGSATGGEAAGIIGNLPAIGTPGSMGTPGGSRSVTNSDGSTWQLEWSGDYDTDALITSLDGALASLTPSAYAGLNWLTLAPQGPYYANLLIGGVPIYFWAPYGFNDCTLPDNPLDGTTGDPSGGTMPYSAADGSLLGPGGIDPLDPEINLPVSLWVIDAPDQRFIAGGDVIAPLFGGAAPEGGFSPLITYLQSQVQTAVDMPYAIIQYIMMSDGSLVIDSTEGVDVCTTSTISANTPMTIDLPTRAAFPGTLFSDTVWPVGRLRLFMPNCDCIAWEDADPWTTLEPAA